MTVANINKKKPPRTGRSVSMKQNLQSSGSDRHATRILAWMKIQICGTCKRGSRAVRELMGVTIILKEKNKQTNFKK